MNPEGAGRRFSALAEERIFGPPTRLVGLALCRVCTGLVCLLVYGANYNSRFLIWGPHGSIPLSIWGQGGAGPASFSVYTAIGSSDHVFNVVFHLGILVALLTVFVGGRVIQTANAVLFVSLVNRNFWTEHGGDKIARLLLPLMAVSIATAYLSPFARWTRHRLVLAVERRSVGLAIHNIATYAMLIQLMTIYVWTSFWKLTGTPWERGYAMWSISQLKDYQGFGLPTLIVNNPVLTTLLSYTVVGVQLGVAVTMIRGRRFHLWFVLLTLFMHVGIAFGMGLYDFGFIMIGFDLVLLSDREYGRVSRIAERALRVTSRTIRQRRQRTPRTAPVGG